MSLDENSSREEVLVYIENFPYDFLTNFSGNTWAQPYIDEAAKMSVREEPFSFLCYFSENPWAQPYIDEAIKTSIAFSPFYFLDYFFEKPWAQPYIDEVLIKEAAKEKPEFFLKNWSNRFPQGIDTALFALGGKNVAE